MDGNGADICVKTAEAPTLNLPWSLSEKRFGAHTSRAWDPPARPECVRSRSARNLPGSDPIRRFLEAEATSSRLSQPDLESSIPSCSMWVGCIERGVVFGCRMPDIE
jgi:hypothetical protein